ncbi:hypothetical protein ACWCQZ_51305, partial [Streptomyces sp. NPDC002285]
MNPERFEERLMHELKNHVQERAQQAGAEETAGVQPGRSRRVRWVPVAVAAGLTAAVAATTLALGQSASQDAGGGMGRITNVAYTLEQQDAGKVKIIIEDPSGKPDAEGLRRDLARMGVKARVLLGDPECPAFRPPAGATGKSAEATAPTPSASLPTEDAGVSDPFPIRKEDGKTVAYVDPHIVAPGNTLIVGFPAARTDQPLGSIMIGEVPGDGGPNCIPA